MLEEERNRENGLQRERESGKKREQWDGRGRRGECGLMRVRSPGG